MPPAKLPGALRFDEMLEPYVIELVRLSDNLRNLMLCDQATGDDTFTSALADARRELDRHVWHGGIVPHGNARRWRELLAASLDEEAPQ